MLRKLWQQFAHSFLLQGIFVLVLHKERPRNSNPANSAAQQNSIPPIQLKSNLSLKLIKDSIPKFDGKSTSLIHFIKQC